MRRRFATMVLAGVSGILPAPIFGQTGIVGGAWGCVVQADAAACEQLRSNGSACKPDHRGLQGITVVAVDQATGALNWATTDSLGAFTFNKALLSIHTWDIQVAKRTLAHVQPPTDGLGEVIRNPVCIPPPGQANTQRPAAGRTLVAGLGIFLVSQDTSAGGRAEPRCQPRPFVLDRFMGKAINAKGTELPNVRVTVLGFPEPPVAGPDRIAETITDTKGRFATVAMTTRKSYAQYMVIGGGTGRLPDSATVDSCSAATEIVLRLRNPAESEPGGAKPKMETSPRRVFDPQTLQALPLRGTRSFDQLALMLPGVVPAPRGGTAVGPGISPNVGTPGQFSAYGVRSRENDFTVDQTDNNDEEAGVRRQGFVLATPQVVESVGELQILPGLYGAQFGRASGAQVNAISMAGKSDFHGTVGGFLTDRRWDAQNFFDNARATTGAVPFTRYMTGASIGGPIRKPSLFVFASWERDGVHSSRQSHFAVPLPEQRAFPAGVQEGDRSVYASTLVGDSIFSFYPFPNNPAGPYGANTYTTVLPANQAGELFAVRLDNHFHLGRRDHSLSLRYNRAAEDSELPQTGGALLSSLRPQVESQSIAALLNTNLNPSITNTVRSSWGVARYRFQPLGDTSSGRPEPAPFLLNRPLQLNETDNAEQPRFVAANYADPALAGILAGSGPVYAEAITGPLGEIQLGGFSSVGVDSYHFPQRRSDDTFQVADTLSKVRGKHVLTAGFEFWYVRLNSDLNRNAAPVVSFYGQRNFSFPSFGGTPVPLSKQWLSATDLAAAGVPGMTYRTLTTTSDFNLQLDRKQADWFLQDDWRVWTNLELSVGIRFHYGLLAQRDFDRPLFQAELVQAAESCGRLVNTIVNFQAACRLFVNNLQANYAPQISDRRPFIPDPRIGLAWSWDRKTVLRAAAGIYSGQFPAIVLNEERSAFPTFSPLAIRPATVSPTTLYRLPVNKTLNGLAAANPIEYLAQLQENTSAVLNVVQSTQGIEAPYAAEYGMTLERAATKGTAISVGYVGSRGLHLLKVSPTVPLAQTTVSVVPARAASGNFPDFSAEYVNSRLNAAQAPISNLYFGSTGASRYDSLQAEIRSERRWLRAGWAFTWSHSRDDGSDFFNTASSFATPQDPLAPSERASSDFDVRLRSVAHFVLDSPWQSPALRGWALAGIVSVQTGQPFTVNTSYDVNQDGWLTDRLATTAGLTGPGMGLPATADSAVQLALRPHVSGTDLLSPASQVQADVFGSCVNSAGAKELNVCNGAVGRNTFRSASQQTVDLAVSRSIALRERLRATLRLEAYDVLNRVNFAVPDRILESPGFGRAVATASPNRMLQFVVKVSF